MKVWRVNHVFEGKFLPIIDGARPDYGGFDFRISDGEGEEIEVMAGCEEAQRWLPYIEAGIKERSLELREEGHRFMGIQVEITRIYSHDLDTTEKGMRYRGRWFLDQLLNPKWSYSSLRSMEE